MPPQIDIARYEPATHQRVDYVLVWSTPTRGRRRAARPARLRAVWTLAPCGLAQLYRRKDWESGRLSGASLGMKYLARQGGDPFP